MKKPVRLEDIPKEQLFQVPDNYFDELPGKIQKRIIAQKQKAWYALPVWQGALRYALPAMALVLVVFGVSKLLLLQKNGNQICVRQKL